MRIKTNCFTHTFLRRYVEIRDLEFQFIEMVLEKAEVVTANKGEKLLDCLFNDPLAIFLIQGQVSCQSGLLKKQVISADSREALSMLNLQLPKGGAIFAVADNTVLLVIKKKDIGQARIQSNKPLLQKDRSYNIAEIDSSTAAIEDDDWMSVLLSSPLFRHLDPGKIHKLFVNLKETNYKAGELVIREGEHDHYFYIIKSGRAQVLPNTPAKSALIEIGQGRFFGEGAIVGETIHSASIRMLTDGVICSIEAACFNEILKDTVLKFATPEQISAVGPHFQKLDVRHPVEFRHQHPPDAINIPINNLRNRLAELSKDNACIICYAEDKRSQLAALILAEHGYNTLLLKTEVL